MRFSNSNRNEFENWLSLGYVHDSIVTEYFYEIKSKTLHITLVNAHSNTKMDFNFEDIRFLSIINKNEFGNSEEVLVGVLENDYSFLEDKLNVKESSYIENSLYLVFQMFSMDELHILFESVLLDVIDNSIVVAEILDMLDWENPSEIQEKGRKLAYNSGTIDSFIQPITDKHSKDVWENCAKIVSLQSDDALQFHSMKLFEWIQDMNWPGAEIIYKRLLSFSADKIRIPYELSVKVAEETNDEVWKEVLLDFWRDHLNQNS